MYQIKRSKPLAQAQHCKKCYILKPLIMSDGAVHFLLIDDMTYHLRLHALQRTSSLLAKALSPWHKRPFNINFSFVETFSCYLNISYTDDSDLYIYDSCQRAKVTNIYNCKSQNRAKRQYQSIHIDLVRPISPTGFAGECYFCTFTGDCTRMTETYIGTKKSNWLKCLKKYHTLFRIWFKEKHPIERLRSDYSSKLQSLKVNKWMQKEEIMFEPSTQYSQKQNIVSEQMGRTIIDMTKETILDGNINDRLFPDLVLAMNHVKNCWPTSALQNLNPPKAHFQERPNLSNLWILSSIICVLLHEQERSMKSEKWTPKALKGGLEDYDDNTTHQVYIKS